MSGVFDREFYRNRILIIRQYDVPSWLDFDGIDPRPLFGLHLVQLSLHGYLLPPKENYSSGSYKNRSEVKPEASPIPLRGAIPLGLLLCSGHLVVVAYVLKRADYTIPIGIIGAWPIFALGFSLISDQRCPSFLEALYKPLPICQSLCPDRLQGPLLPNIRGVVSFDQREHDQLVVYHFEGFDVPTRELESDSQTFLTPSGGF